MRTDAVFPKRSIFAAAALISSGWVRRRTRQESTGLQSAHVPGRPVLACAAGQTIPYWEAACRGWAAVEIEAEADFGSSADWEARSQGLMKDFFIHIGYPKSASTALQLGFFKLH